MGGYRFPEEMGEAIAKETGLNFLGKIEYDKNVENYVLAGKSLLDIPSTSTAYKSVKMILSNAGYR